MPRRVCAKMCLYGLHPETGEDIFHPRTGDECPDGE